VSLAARSPPSKRSRGAAAKRVSSAVVWIRANAFGPRLPEDRSNKSEFMPWAQVSEGELKLNLGRQRLDDLHCIVTVGDGGFEG
jgi:hypothetical protein